ncbi:MAG: cupredoxin domain-containing protein [Actinomycetota bacterium]
MRRKLPIMLSLSLSLGLGAAACAQDDPAITAEGGGDESGGQEDQGEGHEEQGTKMIAGEQATYHGDADVRGSSEFEIEADDFYFGPTVLEGEAGQTLSLALHNEGGAAHTFTIDEAGIDEELQPDAEATVGVTFPASGALVFYCRFHRGSGMLGALSVGGSLDAGGSEDSEDSESLEGSPVPDYEY